MNIFHQARKEIGLIASLLGQSADVAWWKIGVADGLVIFLNVPYLMQIKKPNLELCGNLPKSEMLWSALELILSNY